MFRGSLGTLTSQFVVFLVKCTLSGGLASLVVCGVGCLGEWLRDVDALELQVVGGRGWE
ncbi:MAG: hypothetical protein ABW185_10940 [Sedimenticola sp.]